MASCCLSFPLSKYTSFKISMNAGNYGENYGNYGVSMLLNMAGVRVYNGSPIQPIWKRLQPTSIFALIERGPTN